MSSWLTRAWPPEGRLRRGTREEVKELRTEVSKSYNKSDDVSNPKDSPDLSIATEKVGQGVRGRFVFVFF